MPLIIDAKRVDPLLGGSGYDHESNGRIKLYPLVKISNERVFLNIQNLK
jgi:hypothetical protein